jgi:hypothetical protein
VNVVHLNKTKTGQPASKKKIQQPNNVRMNGEKQQFYPRVENLTNIKFTKEKMKLLNYGTQYNMEKPI